MPHTLQTTQPDSPNTSNRTPPTLQDSHALPNQSSTPSSVRIHSSSTSQQQTQAANFSSRSPPFTHPYTFESAWHNCTTNTTQQQTPDLPHNSAHSTQVATYNNQRVNPPPPPFRRSATPSTHYCVHITETPPPSPAVGHIATRHCCRHLYHSS